MSHIFENEHRIGADECAIHAKDYQNASISDYSTWNTYMMKCNRKGERHLEEFANNNINLHFRNGYGYTNGCEVDNDTELRLNGKITHEKAKSQLFTRSFLAVPDLSKGLVLPEVESRLVEGDDTTQIRECYRLTEVDYERFVPLIPCLRDNVQNPVHIIPPWTNGGDNSRILMKNSATLKACGYRHNGKYWGRDGDR